MKVAQKKKKYLLGGLIGLAILAVVFFLLTYKTPSVEGPKTPLSPIDVTYEIVIKNKKIVSGDKLLKAKVGDTVLLKITSDQGERFHLHGYDIGVNLQTNKMSQIEFTANKVGKFLFELEHSKTELGTLEVQDK